MTAAKGDTSNTENVTLATAAEQTMPPRTFSKRERRILRLFRVCPNTLKSTITASSPPLSVIRKPRARRRHLERWCAHTAVISVANRAKWMHLPAEVRESIAYKLSLADLHAACLGGLAHVPSPPPLTSAKSPYPVSHHPVTPQQDRGAEDGITARDVGDDALYRVEDDVFRRVFRNRVASLRPLYDTWIRRSRGGATRSRRLATPPTTFSSETARLTIRGNDEADTLHAVYELCKLREVNADTLKRDVDGRGRSGNDNEGDGGGNGVAGVVEGGRLTRLPDLLARCNGGGGIRVLTMRRAGFVRLPECVLTMHALQWLDISHCENLVCLPDALGSQCSRLRIVDISHCCNVTVLPSSLLTRLESNTGRAAMLVQKLGRLPRGEGIARPWRMQRRRRRVQGRGGVDGGDEGGSEGAGEGKVPLRLTVRVFGREYLMHVVGNGRFPHVFEGLRTLRGWEENEVAANAAVVDGDGGDGNDDDDG